MSRKSYSIDETEGRIDLSIDLTLYTIRRIAWFKS